MSAGRLARSSRWAAALAMLCSVGLGSGCRSAAPSAVDNGLAMRSPRERASRETPTTSPTETETAADSWLGSEGAPDARLAAVIQVVPGRLAVHVYSHVIYDDHRQAIPCVSFVSAGLEARRQKELIFTLFKTPALSEHGAAILDLYRQIYGFAEAGHLVDAGGRTTMDGRFLGDFSGVAYVKAEPIPGIPNDPERLALLLALPAELPVLATLGPNRLVSALAQRYRHYPQPGWNDPGRPPVLSAADLEDSIIRKTGTLPLPGAHVSKDGGTLRLELLGAHREALLRAIAQRPALLPALITTHDPDASGRLVWHPGQSGAQAIAVAAETQRISGGFLVLYPQATTDGGKILEDGFVAGLTPASWARFCAALQAGRPFSLPAAQPGALGFEVVIRTPDDSHLLAGSTVGDIEPIRKSWLP